MKTKVLRILAQLHKMDILDPMCATMAIGIITMIVTAVIPLLSFELIQRESLLRRCGITFFDLAGYIFLPPTIVTLSVGIGLIVKRLCFPSSEK